MKSFEKFINEDSREVSFDYSKEPRSAIGAVDTDKIVKIASILLDGPITEKKFRLALVYVNPRRDTGSIFDVFPSYGSPACSSVEDLRALNPEVNDVHNIITQAVNDFERSAAYQNVTRQR